MQGPVPRPDDRLDATAAVATKLPPLQVEVCVDCVASIDAVASVLGRRAPGAIARLELCSALGLDGLTPSPGLARYAARQLPEAVELHAMLRPRAGDFFYSGAEVALMLEEMDALARELGARLRGVVFGALAHSGSSSGGECSRIPSSIDVAATTRIIEAAHARGLEATFHRAIGVTDRSSYRPEEE